MFTLNRFHSFACSLRFSLSANPYKNVHRSSLSDARKLSQDMPVLSDFISILQKEFGSDFSKLPNRHATLLIMVQHGFATIAPLMESILGLGIEPKQIVSTTKPHTTSPEMLTYFHRRFGANYLKFQWSRMQTEVNERLTKDEKTPYQIASEETYKALLVKVCKYLDYSASPDIKNIIICDEGGEFLKVFIDRYLNPDQNLKKLSAYRVVAIEHTKSGVNNQILAKLPFPMINMADSFLKTQIESTFIAKSMMTGLKNVFIEIADSRSAIIGIIGGGNIGKAVLQILQQEYPEAKLIFYDQESGVLHAEELKDKSFNRVMRAELPEDIYKKASIILGCTGSDITHHSFFTLDWLKKNPHAQVHFISCSSGDREFYSLLQQTPGYQLKSVEDIHDWHILLHFDKQQTLIIHNGGFPINFVATQGVPAHEIQVTRSMKLAAIVQALKLLEMMTYESNQEKHIQLDVGYQYEIIHSFYKYQSGLFPDEKIKENNINERGPISINEIIHGSAGVSQVTIKHLINFPFYVKTSYQARLEKMLTVQREPIRRMAIHGPAGSGKTFLSEYILKVAQLTHPVNITRKLIADGRERWFSSLREWAEELSPGLRELLKAEIDQEKQHRMIMGVIHSALKQTPWHVLVDNWDVDTGPSIHDILQVEVGRGTLLLTTQAASPFGKGRSLDLSRGFAEEESEALFHQAMNLSEELGIDKDSLGNDAQCKYLLRIMNYLPLAIVQAGRYLLLENKKRQQFGHSIFSYMDYQELLLGELDILIKQHENLYQNKADVPQKTQEAAIKISLTKFVDSCKEEKKIADLFVLYFCSYIASVNIPQLLIKDFMRTVYSYLTEEEVQVTEEEVQAHFERFIDRAKKYSFIRFEDDISIADNLNSLQLHRVTQRVLRKNEKVLIESLDKTGFHGELKEALFFMMSETFSSRVSGASMQMSIKESYVFHLIFLIYNLVNSDCKSEKINYLLFDQLKNLGWAMLQFGMYRLAENIFRDLLAVQSKGTFYGEKQYLGIALAQYALATTLERLGQYEEAQELVNKVLKTGLELSDKNLRNLAESILAPLLVKMGNYESAEKLHRKLLTEVVGLDLAAIKKNLAVSLLHLGRYAEAVFYLKQALAETVTGLNTDQHFLVSAIKHDLGVALKGLGRLQESERFLLEALATGREYYGSENNIAIALIQLDLSSTYLILRRLEEAIGLLQKALATMEAHYDKKENITIGLVYQNLGIAYYKSFYFDKSETAFKKALSIKSKHYGTEKHLDVASTKMALAMLYKTMKKYDEALSYALQCEEIFSTHPGGHQYLSTCLETKKDIEDELSKKNHASSLSFRP